MKYSRRDLRFVLPALAAAAKAAQKNRLPSKTYLFEDLPVQASGPNAFRQVFDGETHSGFAIEAHLTELAPGEAPHPPHHHLHEELITIHRGTVEVTIAGRSTRLGPGSTAYVASNEEHGWHNVGKDHALYMVLAFGADA
jgi:quercetin dioxygenase-like cupin family protein